MAHEDLLTAFVIVTALAVVMQAALLLGLVLTCRRLLAVSMRIEADFKQHVNPMLESVRGITAAVREPINAVLVNLTEITGLVRRRAVTADAVAAELLERARVDVARLDDLFTATLDRVERAAEATERGVLTPVRELSALLAGVRRGLGYFFARSVPGRQQRGPDEEQLFV